MSSFTRDGVSIAFDDISPQGPAARTVVLVHGFASNRAETWRRTGWYGAFERRGVRTIALDVRGHGESARLHDTADYEYGRMAGDVLALMDHLSVRQADLLGYSMGARIALAAACAAPARISNLMLGGVGDRMLQPGSDGSRQALIEALLTDDPRTIAEPMLQGFRQFADQQGEDRRALAAVVRAGSPPIDIDALGRLPFPVLIMAGDRDTLAGDPEGLANRFPNGKSVRLRGCDHFSAIPHAATKAAVFDFLDGVDEDDFPPFE